MSTAGNSAQELADRLQRQAWIDDPFTGFTELDRFQAGSPVWPLAPRWSSLELVGEVPGDRRSVTQYVLHPAAADDVTVPLAVMWDRTGTDERARIYYNKKPLGSDMVRPPCVAPEPDLDKPDFIVAYLAGVRAGDRELIGQAVDADARVQAPFGEITGAQFQETISSTPPDGLPKGVPLQLCTLTYAPPVAAAEFISWRRPPHAGLAVYTQGESGRICEIRVYEGPMRR